DNDCLELVDVACKPVFVGLSAPEQPVLLESVVERFPNRVRKDHEPDGVAIPVRVTTGLVIALSIAEAKPVPGRNRAVVDLHHPQAKPAVCKCLDREVPLEVSGCDEVGGVAVCP